MNISTEERMRIQAVNSLRRSHRRKPAQARALCFVVGSAGPTDPFD